MSFIIYDVVLLVIFVAFTSFFLYKNRQNLKREGLLYLYKAQWGIKLIDKVGKKYKKTLHILSYISISIGYLLMAGMIYLFARIVYLYVAFPSVVRAIKVPPITPLIPYLPQAFKLDFLPPFYFIYWVLILAVIAIPHEFAHGIFMRRYNIKIKSTGFGFFPYFLPIFLAAFVEQDEKSMKKASSFKQMAVLSAGTFANILTAILFFIIMWLFFSLSFVPAGAEFNTYSYSALAIAGITSFNGVELSNPTYDQLLALSDDEELNEIKSGDKTYLATKEIMEEQINNQGQIVVYDNAPAVKVGLEGAIVEVDGIKISDWDSFSTEILKNSPGDMVTLKTKVGDEFKEYELELTENPDQEGMPFVGIGYAGGERSGLLGNVIDFLSSFRKEYLHYEPKFEAAWFIYNFIWWLVLISFSVALVNMLPVGIFDGGRFFYLTILSITKSEKKAIKSFNFLTYLFLFLLFLLMVFWARSFF